MSVRSDGIAPRPTELLADFASGFTKLPHDLLDWIIPVLSEAELRVLLYVARRTYGFHKLSDRISLNQFSNGLTSRTGVALDLGTGLSRQGVLNAIHGLRAKGVLKVVPGRGRSQVSEYEISLSEDLAARIGNLKITPRESVKDVDFSRKRKKGQRQLRQKVNRPAPLATEEAYGVDQQYIAFRNKEDQKKAERQMFPKPLLEPKNNRLDLLKTNPSEHGRDTVASDNVVIDGLIRELRLMLGPLQSREEIKLRRRLSMCSEETARAAIGEFSTETYWLESSSRVNVFLTWLEGKQREHEFGEDVCSHQDWRSDSNSY